MQPDHDADVERLWMEVLTTGRCTRCGKVFAFAADEVPSECPFCSRVLTRRWSGIHKQQLMNT